MAHIEIRPLSKKGSVRVQYWIREKRKGETRIVRPVAGEYNPIFSILKKIRENTILREKLIWDFGKENL